MRQRVHRIAFPLAAALVAFCMLAGVSRPGTVRAATRSAGSTSCGAVVPAPPAAPPTAASLTLSRTKGPAGMLVDIGGTGWPAGATVIVDVDANMGDNTRYTVFAGIVHVTVAADGTFQMPRVSVPQPQACVAGPISGVEFVAHTSDNSASAEASFTYVSPLMLISNSPLQVRPGFAVLLTGYGWEPGEEVTITSSLSSNRNLSACLAAPSLACAQGTTLVPSATAHATANDQGQINLTYALPGGLSLAPRTGVLVQATGTGPLYGTVEAAPLQFVILPPVDPTMTLNRASGAPGAAVIVRGTNWYPGDTVQIEYCRGQSASVAPGEPRCSPDTTQALGQVIVGASGQFTSTVSVPTDARTGPITIQARVPNDIFGLSVYAQAAAFQVVPPPLPWDRQHPRLALVLSIAQPAAPALVLGALLLAAYLWSRRRARQPVAPAHAE